MADYYVKNSFKIVFVFLYSESRPFYLKSLPSKRIIVSKLNEPSKEVAYQYFKHLRINPLFFKDLELITGGIFKYFFLLSFVDSQLPKEEFLKSLFF